MVTKTNDEDARVVTSVQGASSVGLPATGGRSATVVVDRPSRTTIDSRAPATAEDRAFLHMLIHAFVHGQSADDLAVRVERAVPGISSWPSLERLVQTHRCSALAYRLLSQPVVRQASAMPAATLDALRARYVAAFTQIATEPVLLGTLLDAFAEADIPVILVKGLAVGTWLYDDPAMREHDDIDFLVRVNQADDANALLTGLGYRSGYRPPLYFGEAPGTADYRRAAGELHVDLSFDPLRVFWAPDLESDPFHGWQIRRQHLSIGSRLVPTLGAEDQFIHLARHLQFHDYFRANWFVDVLLLLRRFGPELDWRLIGRLAAEHGLQGGLYRTLELATDLYDVALPDEARRALHPNVLVYRMHRRIWPDAIALPRDRARKGGAPISPRFLSPRGTHPFAGLLLLSLDRNRGRNLRYLVRRIVPPASWLRTRYGADGGQRQGWLLLRHWRELRAYRRFVGIQHKRPLR